MIETSGKIQARFLNLANHSYYHLRPNILKSDNLEDPNKVPDHVQGKISMPNPSQEPPTSFTAPNKDLKGMDVLSTFNNMDVSKISNHIQIRIKMPNPHQEPPVSTEAPDQDLKENYILCTFKIKIESQNLDHGYIKDQ